MATTTLTLQSNREEPAYVYLTATVSSVALDASASENFIFPAGFGGLMITKGDFYVYSLSGAYVAPTPAEIATYVQILSQGTRVDTLSVVRLFNFGTSSARPHLGGTVLFVRPQIIRQVETINVNFPIIAGAGVTGTVQCDLRGVRLYQS